MKRRQFLSSMGVVLASGWLHGCGSDSSTAVVSLPVDPVPLPVDPVPLPVDPVPLPVDPVPLPVDPVVKSSVIVVGGGMAGATAAKYLRLWGDGIEVTLVERSSTYISSTMSDSVLTGQRSLDDLKYGYDELRTNYGINTVFGDVVGIDPQVMQVTLADGKVLSADRIILAPGIDYDEVQGLVTAQDKEKMPHAWTAGTQTTLLASQLSAMPAGGNVIITNPKVPYRCPPGPYARACELADWLKKNKPGSTVTFLDANPDYMAAKPIFQNAFENLYPDVINYVPNAEVTAANPVTMTLTTPLGDFHGDVINLIPRQRAGKLITQLGLANATENRFAGVDVLSYASTVPGWEKVHIIGDSCGTPQPKAGHLANQQAKVCADAIIRVFAGLAPDPAPVVSVTAYMNVTTLEAAWATIVWQYDPGTKTMVVKPPEIGSFGISGGWSAQDFNDSNSWFDALMVDSFA